MPLDDVRDLYRYNDWANARWVSALAAVPLASTDAVLGGPYGSLRGAWAPMPRARRALTHRA